MLTSQAVRIFVNGDPFEVPSGSSISSLLAFLKIAPDRVAVELNKGLVRKRDWDVTSVDSGAQIEVVEFVGGG
jgi:thiamine biosynthesis protein ThiS